MSAIRSRRASAIAAVVPLALALALAAPAAAAEPAFQATFDAGTACAGFDLQVTGYGSGSQVVREFTTHDGTVLSLAAGTGYSLQFANASTGATYDLRSNGAVSWGAWAADGSGSLTLLGHNVVILFPSDGGPSTTLYTGRVRIGIATDGVWTVGKAAGSHVDICAALR
jgi:hypothetical protein